MYIHCYQLSYYLKVHFINLIIKTTIKLKPFINFGKPYFIIIIKSGIRIREFYIVIIYLQIFGSLPIFWFTMFSQMLVFLYPITRNFLGMILKISTPPLYCSNKNYVKNLELETSFVNICYFILIIIYFGWQSYKKQVQSMVDFY